MNPAETLPPARHELTEGSPVLVVLTALGLLAGLALVLLAAAGFQKIRQRDRSPLDPAGRQSSFTGSPQARTGIARDWAAQDAAVREHLTTYGWVAREAGVVRIPIDRAIELVAADSDSGSAGRPSKP